MKQGKKAKKIYEKFMYKHISFGDERGKKDAIFIFIKDLKKKEKHF